MKVSPALLDPFVQNAQFNGTLGDYRIVRELGRGGMGIVYEAEEISLRRRVALKVFPFATILDPRQLQRFKNEALAAAQLKHAHIVNVFAVVCERGVHFYAMEYIEGLSLQEFLTEFRGSPKPEPPNEDRPQAFQETLTSAGFSTNPESRSGEHFPSVARLGLQAAETLEHAHSLGIVHRDIKPANLMVDRTGQLLITDFGLAQMESDAGLTMTGDVLGTLRYMSPEQAAGDRRRMDHRTDIYSLGATLYELLTLRPMFSESNRRELLAQILHINPPSLRGTHPAISRDLETIIEKATAKDPQDRYNTAQKMAEDLRCFLENRPILARRTTWLERLAKWLRRNTPGVMIALALLILFSLGLIAATLFILREQAETRQALMRVEEERKLAERQQELAQRLSTTLAVDRGLTYCETGQIAHGLLWLARGLELSSSQEGELQRVIRSNLNDWSRHAVTLDHVFALPSSSAVEAVAFSPSGEFAAVATGRKVHLFPLKPAQEGLAEKSFAHSAPLTAITFAPDEWSASGFVDSPTP